MRILVTGAAGFIGFFLIKLLCKNNFKVIGVDNLNTYYDVNLKILFFIYPAWVVFKHKRNKYKFR